MKILKLRIAQSPLTPTKKTEVPILPKRGLKEIKSKKLRALHQKTKKKNGQPTNKNLGKIYILWKGLTFYAWSRVKESSEKPHVVCGRPPAASQVEVSTAMLGSRSWTAWASAAWSPGWEACLCLFVSPRHPLTGADLREQIGVSREARVGSLLAAFLLSFPVL